MAFELPEVNKTTFKKYHKEAKEKRKVIEHAQINILLFLNIKAMMTLIVDYDL